MMFPLKKMLYNPLNNGQLVAGDVEEDEEAAKSCFPRSRSRSKSRDRTNKANRENNKQVHFNL